MKHLGTKFLATMLILLWISGCATTGTQQGTQNPTKTDSTQTKAAGAGWGALAGALVGGAVALATGDSDHALQYAAAGAAVGAAAGYIAGNRVAKIKEQYATDEDRLNGEIALASQMNQETQDRNTTTQNQISAIDQQINEINSKSSSLEERKKQLAIKNNEIGRLVKENTKAIANMNTEKKALADYKSSLSNTQQSDKMAKLEQEISGLETNIAMLDQSNQQLAKLSEAMTVSK